MFPFRSRLQRRLRQERLNKDLTDFTLRLGDGPHIAEISKCLWDKLREVAFVPDFRPDIDDNLMDIYAIDGEEVRDDLVEPIVEVLGIDTSNMDFSNLDFSSISTPKGVAGLLVRIASA